MFFNNKKKIIFFNIAHDPTFSSTLIGVLECILFGLAFGFAGSEQAIQIEVRSASFERTIQELESLYAAEPNKLKQINKISLRWKFIRNTLLAYNERSAPFAVSRTVGYIRDQLAEI